MASQPTAQSGGTTLTLGALESMIGKFYRFKVQDPGYWSVIFPSLALDEEVLRHPHIIVGLFDDEIKLKGSSGWVDTIMVVTHPDWKKYSWDDYAAIGHSKPHVRHPMLRLVGGGGLVQDSYACLNSMMPFPMECFQPWWGYDRQFELERPSLDKLLDLVYDRDFRIRAGGARSVLPAFEEAVESAYGGLRSLQSLIIQYAEQGLSPTTKAIAKPSVATSVPSVTRPVSSVARSAPSTARSTPSAAGSVPLYTTSGLSIARSAPLNVQYAVTPEYLSRRRGLLSNSPSTVREPAPEFVVGSIDSALSPLHLEAPVQKDDYK